MKSEHLVQITSGNHDETHAELINPDSVEATDNAYPTSRLLDGSSDHGYAEEWAEPAVLPDGRDCTIMYLFDDDDIIDKFGEKIDAEFYPWDADHIRRIVCEKED